MAARALAVENRWRRDPPVLKDSPDSESDGRRDAHGLCAFSAI